MTKCIINTNLNPEKTFTNNDFVYPEIYFEYLKYIQISPRLKSNFEFFKNRFFDEMPDNYILFAPIELIDAMTLCVFFQDREAMEQICKDNAKYMGMITI